jgi:hypothetical protein
LFAADTIQSASASQSLDFFDFFLGAKFHLELHWHQPQLSQQFSQLDAVKFKLFETRYEEPILLYFPVTLNFIMSV